jgi:hypothetical protein
MNWALGVQLGGPGEKAVLMALANYADENNDCYPSQERLARETCQGVRTVQRHLATLQERGLIVKRARGGSGGGRWNNWYRLMVGAQPANLAPSSGGYPPSATGLPATGGGSYPPPVAQEPSLEPPLSEPPPEKTPSPDGDGAPDELALIPASKPTPAQTRAMTDASLSDEFENQFWPAYPRKVGKHAALAVYRRVRRKGATVDDVMAGVHRFAAEKAHTEARFIAHPATWLNAGRWLDTPEEDPSRRPAEAATSKPWLYRDEDYWSTT